MHCDVQALLLSTWIRTGFWVMPAAWNFLEIELMVETDENAPLHNAVGNCGTAPVTTVLIQLAGGKVAATVHIDATTLQPSSFSLTMASDVEHWQFLEWQSWSGAVEHGVQFPLEIMKTMGSGSVQRHSIESVSIQTMEDVAIAAMEASAVSASIYTAPNIPLLPPDAAFLPGIPSATKAWFTKSGHIIVQPKINGVDGVGCFILDTGRSK
jgi:hypothetical protein